MIHSLRDNGPIFASSCAAPCVISGLRFTSGRHTRPVAQRSAVAAGEIKRLITVAGRQPVERDTFYNVVAHTEAAPGTW